MSSDPTARRNVLVTKQTRTDQLEAHKSAGVQPTSKLTLAARAEPGALCGGCFLGGTGRSQAGRPAWLAGSAFTLLGVKSSCFLQHSGNLASAWHRPHPSWG